MASSVAPNFDDKLYFLAIFPSIASVKKAIAITIVAHLIFPKKYSILNIVNIKLKSKNERQKTCSVICP